MGNKCEVCPAVLKSKRSKESVKWDWFTGYLNRTHHYCPECAKSNHRKAAYRKSKIASEWKP